MSDLKERADPKVRRDGCCARRGCTNKLPETARLRGDPFCSAPCAKEFHGVENKGEDKKGHTVSPASKRMINNTVRRRS